MRLLLRATVVFHGKGVRPVWLSSLRSALRNIRISGPPFTVTDPPRSTRTVVGCVSAYSAPLREHLLGT